MKVKEINVGDTLTFGEVSGVVKGIDYVAEKAWTMTIVKRRYWGVVNFADLISSEGVEWVIGDWNPTALDEIVAHEPHSLPHLPKGSIIQDVDGVLGQGANRNWIIQRPAKKKRIGKNKNGEWLIRGASNYTVWTINKRTGDIGSWKNSKGVGGYSLHRLLKRNTDIRLLRYGSGSGDSKENKLSEPDKDYTEFLESLSVQDWLK